MAATAFFVAFCWQRPWLAFVAAVVATPFLFTVGGYPHPIGYLGARIALLANFGSAWLLSKRHHRLATISLIPFLIVATVVAYLVFTQ